MNAVLSFGGGTMENQSKTSVRSASMQNRGVIYQVSLLQGMLYGDYNGSVTIQELKEHGNTGIGTFNGLNGELIMLDGTVYRASGDGQVEPVTDSETSPFAVVTDMDTVTLKHLENIPDRNALYDELNQLVDQKGKNRFYMIRIDGLFRKVNVRSVPAQRKPYKHLVEVMEQEQRFFDYEQIEGTMVGLYCPPYMSHLNAVGWHMHFISKDKTKGGHMLGLDIADAILTWTDADSFQLKLPQNRQFNSFDLTVDQSRDIEKIETNK